MVVVMTRVLLLAPSYRVSNCRDKFEKLVESVPISERLVSREIGSFQHPVDLWKEFRRHGLCSWLGEKRSRLGVLVEDSIEFVVAFYGQDLGADGFIPKIQTVEVVLTIRSSLLANELDSHELRPMFLGKLGEADGFVGIVISGWIVGFEYVEAQRVAILADDDKVREHGPVSYTHLRAHETVLDLVCRLLLEKNK